MTAAVQGTERIYSTRFTPSVGGPYPLKVRDAGGRLLIELLRDPAAPEVYTSMRSFLAGFHGPDYVARHWSLDRYLGERPLASESSFSIVGPLIPAQFERSRAIVVGPSLPRRAPVIGIDLRARGHEVAKLLHAGFDSWIRSSGYDFEDVLQEVFRKILVANAGTRPWDPAKSSFGHYVHLVCRSALSNYHRKATRIASREQIGMVVRTRGSEATSAVDAREAVLARTASPQDGIDPVIDLSRHLMQSRWSRHPDLSLALKLLPLLQAGHTLKDAAAILAVPRPLVSRAIALLRTSTTDWLH